VPITVELMRAMSHAGNYVAGAVELDPQGGRAGSGLVGASVGFFAAPPGEVLHSHVTGAVRRGAGFALKLHQRAWALRGGMDRITWTYDPLVRRNAHFNLAKLGARPEAYLRDFYGVMGDAINADDESDRVLAVWHLTQPHVVRACEGGPYGQEAATADDHRQGGPAHGTGLPRDARLARGRDVVAGVADRDGHPVVGRDVGPGDGRLVAVGTPEDIETLRRTDPGAAKAWRHAVRDVLGGLMDGGARVIGFAQGSYILETTPTRGEGRQ
jgi:predicted GNAT superfamily acetyltransferase